MPALRSLEQQAVDLWLRRCLRQQHAAVLSEPVPDALLQLLKQREPA